MTTSPAHTLAGLVTGIHHHGLVVADLDQAVEFYSAELRFHEEFRVTNMGDLFQRTVGVPGITCDLVQLRNETADTRLELIRVHAVPAGLDPSLPVHVGVGHTAFLVTDIAAAVEATRRAGGEMLGEIVEFSEGPAAYLRSPGGIIFELEEPTTQEETGYRP
ncbi:VOC family protein [Leucobacter aridicollis]|uniref:Catechol 2,3-dioxygenase-like lactoylglutathione lyase family enzyme n=1 Tax=Leucobacter aridicollis TaxID=283878 RepID=A0A852R5I8_9MICO|nr:VOC family protein [Leucobacter aridicollis]MBL3680920.1 hypothetical protein [Leucobacter aridicollis]NYD28077.1 catechol 2,3-dioxygenase-like lactoylglutathione lyase family enzyme [Leucobacter aridicollis]